MKRRDLLTQGEQQKLYLKLADTLRQGIANGVFPPNEMLPSETEMVAQYGVSRITVRQAITLLVEENLVRRIQGRGSFVTEGNFERNMLGSHDLLHDVAEDGTPQSFRVFDYKLIMPPKHFNTVFMLPPGEMVHSFRRIKSNGGTPVILDYLLLPASRLPGLEQKQIETRWIAEILKSDYDITLHRMRKTLQPIVIGSREARSLRVKSRSIGLLVDRITWADGDDAMPILITRSIVKGDHAKFYVNIEYSRTEDGI